MTEGLSQYYQGPDPLKRPVSGSQISALGYQLAREYREIKTVMADIRQDLANVKENVNDLRREIIELKATLKKFMDKGVASV